jgi:hypothetical protein
MRCIMLSTISFLHRRVSYPEHANYVNHIPFLKQDLVLFKKELEMQMYATGVSLSYSQITPSNLFAALDIIQDINTRRTPYSNTYQTITFLNLAGNRVTFVKMNDEQYRKLAHKLVNSGITNLELDGCSSASDNDDVIEKLYEHILAVVKNPLEVRCEPVREAPAALSAEVSQNGVEEIDEKDAKHEFNLKSINQPIILMEAGRVRRKVSYEHELQLIHQHVQNDRVHFNLLYEQAAFLLNNLFKKSHILKDIDSLMPQLRLHVAVDITCEATAYKMVAMALSHEEENGALLREENEKHKKVANEEIGHILHTTEVRDHEIMGSPKQLTEKPKTDSEATERGAALHRRRKSRSGSRPNIFESVEEIGTSASKEVGDRRVDMSGEIDHRFNRNRLLSAINDLEEIAKQLVMSHAWVGNQVPAESGTFMQSVITLLEKHIMTYREMYLLWDALFVYCNDEQKVTRGDTEQDLMASNYSGTTMLDEKDIDYYYKISSKYEDDIAKIGQKMNEYYSGGCHYPIIQDVYSLIQSGTESGLGVIQNKHSTGIKETFEYHGDVKCEGQVGHYVIHEEVELDWVERNWVYPDYRGYAKTVTLAIDYTRWKDSKNIRAQCIPLSEQQIYLIGLLERFAKHSSFLNKIRPDTHPDEITKIFQESAKRFAFDTEGIRFTLTWSIPQERTGHYFIIGLTNTNDHLVLCADGNSTQLVKKLHDGFDASSKAKSLATPERYRLKIFNAYYSDRYKLIILNRGAFRSLVQSERVSEEEISSLGLTTGLADNNKEAARACISAKATQPYWGTLTRVAIQPFSYIEASRFMFSLCLHVRDICKSFNSGTLFGCRRYELSTKEKISLFFNAPLNEQTERKIQDFIFELECDMNNMLDKGNEGNHEKQKKWLNALKKVFDNKQRQWSKLHRRVLEQVGNNNLQHKDLQHKELQAINCISQMLSSSKKAVTTALEVESAKYTKSVKSALSQSSGYMPQPRMNF